MCVSRFGSLCPRCDHKWAVSAEWPCGLQIEPVGAHRKRTCMHTHAHAWMNIQLQDSLRCVPVSVGIKMTTTPSLTLTCWKQSVRLPQLWARNRHYRPWALALEKPRSPQPDWPQIGSSFPNSGHHKLRNPNENSHCPISTVYAGWLDIKYIDCHIMSPQHVWSSSLIQLIKVGWTTI